MEVEKPSPTTVEGLRLALEQLGLSTKGHKPELKQRLRKAKKKLKDVGAPSSPAKTEEGSTINLVDDHSVEEEKTKEDKAESKR